MTASYVCTQVQKFRVSAIISIETQTEIINYSVDFVLSSLLFVLIPDHPSLITCGQVKLIVHNLERLAPFYKKPHKGRAWEQVPLERPNLNHKVLKYIKKRQQIPPRVRLMYRHMTQPCMFSVILRSDEQCFHSLFRRLCFGTNSSLSYNVGMMT